MMGGLNWSDGLRGKHCCHRINLHLPEINTNTPSRRGFLGIRAFYIPMITWWLVFGLARNFNVFLPSVNGSEENWGKSQKVETIALWQLIDLWHFSPLQILKAIWGLELTWTLRTFSSAPSVWSRYTTFLIVFFDVQKRYSFVMFMIWKQNCKQILSSSWTSQTRFFRANTPFAPNVWRCDVQNNVHCPQHGNNII